MRSAANSTRCSSGRRGTTGATTTALTTGAQSTELPEQRRVVAAGPCARLERAHRGQHCTPGAQRTLAGGSGLSPSRQDRATVALHATWSIRQRRDQAGTGGLRRQRHGSCPGRGASGVGAARGDAQRPALGNESVARTRAVCPRRRPERSGGSRASGPYVPAVCSDRGAASCAGQIAGYTLTGAAGAGSPAGRGGEVRSVASVGTWSVSS